MNHINSCNYIVLKLVSLLWPGSLEFAQPVLLNGMKQLRFPLASASSGPNAASSVPNASPYYLLAWLWLERKTPLHLSLLIISKIHYLMPRHQRPYASVAPKHHNNIQLQEGHQRVQNMFKLNLFLNLQTEFHYNYKFYVGKDAGIFC